MCLYTKYIENPKYKPNKKNKFNPPVLKDERLRYVPVECGKCIECRKKKKREWTMRLCEEIRNDNKCYFVTLTFNDESLKNLSKECFKRNCCMNNEETHIVVTKAIRRYLELIRKHTGKSVKHWFITEKGEDFERIHLHGLIWGDKDLLQHWKYGFTYCGKFVNETTINYITKYMLKQCEKDKTFIGKIFASAGIGKGYLKRCRENEYAGKDTNENYRTKTGMKIPLAEYFRRKIYSEEELEKLWIMKQERGYRYICGEKVSTENLEEWENLVSYYQRRAKDLYGEDPTEWEKNRTKKRLQKMNAYLKKEHERLKKVINK